MRKNIQSKDPEILSKFRSLLFTDEVVIDKSKNRQVSRIVSSINSKNKTIESTDIGKYILLKRLQPMNINMVKKR